MVRERGKKNMLGTHHCSRKYFSVCCSVEVGEVERGDSMCITESKISIHNRIFSQLELPLGIVNLPTLDTITEKLVSFLLSFLSVFSSFPL